MRRYVHKKDFLKIKNLVSTFDSMTNQSIGKIINHINYLFLN